MFHETISGTFSIFSYILCVRSLKTFKTKTKYKILRHFCLMVQNSVTPRCKWRKMYFNTKQNVL